MKLIKVSLAALFLLFTTHLLATNSTIERVEPAFWWVGMKNPRLQLLIYGKDITMLQPVINYKGVRIEQVIKVESPNYLFINLLLTDNHNPTNFDIDFQKDGKSVQKYNYRLFAREPGSAERKGFNTSDVMYLITPDRFVNGNPSNDNVSGMKEKANRAFEGGRHGGDIAGMINSLDYIKDLGFTALWINPVLENDQPTYSYHGYSTTDFYKVDPRFGTNEDYQRLSRLAQEKGIKLIMDMIVNHCGSEHWWMKDLPTSDWINFDNKFVNTNHRKPTIQDPYTSQYDYKKFVDGWFVETMPDLNQRNPLMATYLVQNSIWWTEYLGLAGIRMDTYPYPDKDFMTEWTCQMMQEYPNFNIVGEEWVGNPALVAHWQRGKVNKNGYTSCLPSLMDFPLQESLRRALGSNNPGAWNASYEMLAMDFLYADPFNLVIFPDNHDMDRFYTQVNEDFDLFKLGIVYNLTMRGIPQLYYGTEALLSNSSRPGDHGIIRTDFPGGWKDDPVSAFTNKGLNDNQIAAKSFIKKLANWRKTADVIHHGKLMHFAPENGVYVYFRYNDSQNIMIVLNKNEQNQTLDLSRFAEIIKDYKKGKDIISDQEFMLDKTLSVPAKTPLVLVLEK
ncbi:MAG: glycoside hydrolase family 13 protein [Saprospiraceae bacterium]|nr:glycoside hydrolase family 13 protein [Saprospiraceae bacterium]